MPRRPIKHSDPARECAYEVLVEVEIREAFANLLAPKRFRQARLNRRDSSLATELTYGTLRYQGFYDAVLGHGSTRPICELDPEVRVLARLGAHQLLSLRVPTHAAVAETVNLARTYLSDGPVRTVNALLRRVSERSRPQWEKVLEQIPDLDERLGALYSHPAWIVRALRQSLAANGRAGEFELVRLLQANNQSPYVTLVARPGLVTQNELADAAEQELHCRVALGRYVDSSVTISEGTPARLSLIQTRRAGVQDEGSQIVAALSAALPLDGPDKQWLDLCAGPGGKTAYLGAYGGPKGVTVFANEVLDHRAELVRKSCLALANVQVNVADGRRLGAQMPSQFDRVLLDAPCTGLGALRRRPEARWRRNIDDVSKLAQLQEELLVSALQAVRPGGVVIYVTCSPHIRETQLVVEQVLSRSPLAEVIPFHSVWEQIRTQSPFTGEELAVGNPDYLQLWPDEHGCDAMFAALVRRRA